MDHQQVDMQVVHSTTSRAPEMKATMPGTIAPMENVQTTNELTTAASSNMDPPIDPTISVAPSTCHLLDLPAELRIQIWEFVLGEKRDIITISPFNKQLGLIGTCNQVRAEVLDIWLPNTSVVVKVYQCNFETHLAWARLVGRYNPNGSVRVHLVGAKHRVKLVKWLRACHEVGLYHYARMTLESMDRGVQEHQNEIAALTATDFSAKAFIREMDILGSKIIG